MGVVSQLKAHEVSTQTATHTREQTTVPATTKASKKATAKAGLLSTSYFPPQPSPYYLWTQPEQAKTGKQGVGADRAQPILVVDDDPNVLAMVTDILLFEGYAIQTATNGAPDCRTAADAAT